MEGELEKLNNWPQRGEKETQKGGENQKTTPPIGTVKGVGKKIGLLLKSIGARGRRQVRNA